MPQVLGISDWTSKAHKARESSTNFKIRIPKKRAAIACEHCRKKKVRCHMRQSGTPCNNCSLDEIKCVIRENKRRKYKTICNRRDNMLTHLKMSEKGIRQCSLFSSQFYTLTYRK